MISQSDIIMIALAFTVGVVRDATGPKPYHYKNKIVVVYEKYQCPVYCDVDHNHYVYFESDTNGMIIDENQLGKRVKNKKSRKKIKR